MGKLFGTDGVRGIINKELTVELATKIGKAVGTFFGSDSTILIGRDARAGGDMISRAVESGLLSTGVKIFEGGFGATPAIQYGVKTLGYDAGVIITASHNPAEYNGIKVIDRDGVEVSREKENEIEDIFFSDKFLVQDWKKLTYDVKKDDRIIDTYVKGILSHVDVEKIKSKGFKILIDGANSVGSISTPIVARELGCKIFTVNANIDPLFPARTPEPTFESLNETAGIAKQLGVDLAVAHDGDADRAIFIDSLGRVQWGDRSGTLLSYWASTKEKYPRRIFTAVSSSILVQQFLSKYGIEVKWTKVGSVDIAHTLMKESGIAGFEENGGFIFPAHQFVRDGAMSFALMLEMMAIEGITSAQLFDMLPKYYMVKTKVNITNKDVQSSKVYDEIASIYKDKGQIVTIDGIKVMADDFWFLVRKSGTEPIFRVMVEAKDEEKARNLANELVKVLGGMT
ncbi:MULTISPECIES: phosphoglucosamine mutase [Acidianus]|uniref:Phosphoglucomutase n=1 Tax=Candidatus Acidianus copahuensis TaxID=1160895 RepID=A0A031LMB9_9CREN|nr:MULTISPECIES: phosphoglucosamine mutase [Acidianus]EZQ03826.1 phosphoglucomutase [Candidatus Acidianus copahuensis]NON62693.1 phosphoglucosamine mutase [Acidianus sp. RZ1]